MNLNKMAMLKPQEYIFESKETLLLLSSGDTCVIKGFADLEIAKRLLSHGVLPGMHVTKRQASPLGKSSIYDVEGQLIVMRDEEANCVNINYIF